MKKRVLTFVAPIVMVLCFVVSTLISTKSLSRLIRENNAENALVYSNEIMMAVDDVFSEAKVVSEAMNSTFLQEMIEKSSGTSGAELSDEYGKFLKDIKTRFGCDTAFITLQSNLAYYTEWGFVKNLILDNPDDDWFERFRDTNEPFELNIDNDQANDNRITIYVNIRVENDKGEFVAACGVGVTLDGVNTLVSNLEKERNLVIKMISEDGLIQIAGNDQLIKTPASEGDMEFVRLFKARGESYLYENTSDNGYRIVRYDKNCDWYLIIENEQSVVRYYSDIIVGNAIVLSVFLIILVGITVLIGYIGKENNNLQEVSVIDRMTGIKNRRAYEAFAEQIRNREYIRNLVIIVVDMNGLKYVNDNFGHSAGDSCLIALGQHLQKYFIGKGEAYRTGGDEFIVILETDKKFDNEEICNLKKSIEGITVDSKFGFSASIGVSHGNWDECENYDDLVNIADRRMYADKELYYQKEGKERRK